MPSNDKKKANNLSFAYLGPVGTFTELALKQIKEAKGAKQIPVNHVSEATNGDENQGRQALRRVLGA
jgi:prephenate dehydratase